MNERVTFISGSMFAKKSKMLMDSIEMSHKDNGTKYLVFKPTKDTRDGLFVHSRVYERVVKALAWDQDYEDMPTIFSYTISGFALTNPDEDKVVYFDEAHFLSKHEIEYIVETCQQYDLKLVMAGLETTFKQEYFESTKWLKDNCNGYIFFHGRCNFCEEDTAVYNLLYNNGVRVTQGEDLQPGDQEYKVCCEDCFNEL